jgi:ATP-dependent DNA ligase
MLQRTLPAGFIAPCLPTKTDTLPSGGLWIHEIKHDGFRIIARKDGERVTLYSRPGNDFTQRFPPIARALTHLRCRSCIIDGEAVICDDNGVTSFDHIRYRRNIGDVFLYAFDLIELNGDDLRRDPLDVRKATLRSVLTRVGHGIRWKRWATYNRLLDKLKAADGVADERLGRVPLLAWVDSERFRFTPRTCRRFRYILSLR